MPSSPSSPQRVAAATTDHVKLNSLLTHAKGAGLASQAGQFSIKTGPAESDSKDYLASTHVVSSAADTKQTPMSTNPAHAPNVRASFSDKQPDGVQTPMGEQAWKGDYCVTTGSPPARMNNFIGGSMHKSQHLNMELQFSAEQGAPVIINNSSFVASTSSPYNNIGMGRV